MRRELAFLTAAASLAALVQLECATASGGRNGETAGGSTDTAGDGSSGGSPGSSGGASGGGGSSIVIPGDGGRSSRQDAGDSCDGAADCVIGCGNGRLDPGLGEVCDDGNSISGDGCSADCKAVEKDWACLQPGTPCFYLVKCGDGRLGGKETCDDGNAKAGDGCSSTCEIESGWDCLQAAQLCVPHCGDGLLAGVEQCDPPNVGQGCAATCSFEPGFVCDVPGPVPNPAQPAICHRTVCGDSKQEGAEACDDGNAIDGDGCSAACTFEPDCVSGQCVSKCGDGMKLPPEACDDGNTRDGDGCAHDCSLEIGYTCADSSLNPPAQLNLAVTYRDFVSLPIAGVPRHPDFEVFAGNGTSNLVQSTLDTAGKPAIEGRCSLLQPASFTNTTLCPFGQQLTTEANFMTWYRDTPDLNLSVRSALLLVRQVNGSYLFDSASTGFFPVDNLGWTAAPAKELLGAGAHNFGFTTEIRYFFQYRGGETLVFSGDDDVWVFVNRRLGLDLGGLHPRLEAVINMDQSATTLGIVVGSIYEVDLFHAERHTTASNFKLTLTGFAPTYSTCAPSCGDGVIAGREQCDLGRDMNTGGYNGCTADCKHGPFCGDKVVESDHEACDDGLNVTVYTMTGIAGCAPGCVLGGFCGDGRVDGLFGEKCDKGKDLNDGAYNGCTSTCQLGPRCGDGIVQPDGGEQCDDGNTVSGDGCTHDCFNEIPQ